MYKTYYVYIMSNTNDTTLYIGVTNDIERRVKEHRSGQKPGFTQKYNCHKLVYYETYSDIDQAIEREKKLKKRNLCQRFLDSAKASLKMTRRNPKKQ